MTFLFVFQRRSNTLITTSYPILTANPTIRDIRKQFVQAFEQ